MTAEHTIAVVIPWRDSGNPHRRQNTGYVTGYYHRMELGPVIVADDGRTSGQFNRHAAYNRGLAQTTADVILWNEADTLIPLNQILTAAEIAITTPGLVIPFTERHELTPDDTQRVLTGTVDPFTLKGWKIFKNGKSIGQAGVTSRATIDAIGGKWDERFQGWGYDDNAAFHAFATLAGPPTWVDGKGIHLWHPPAFKNQSPDAAAATNANKTRYQQQLNMTAEQLHADLIEAANHSVG